MKRFNSVAQIIFLVLLFLAGIMHWLYFFNFGNLTFQAFDWPKEFKYYSILKEALTAHSIPYHVSDTFQKTNRFLALPETQLSPHIIFLPFMSIAQFIIFNTILLYVFGFIGCLLIRRHYKLTLLPFLILYLLFNYNGYITSHIAVGHSMWAGYFLLPFFCLFVLELLEEKRFLASVMKLSLLLFVIILQGAFHIFVWCALFLILIAIFNRIYIKPIFLTILLSIFLSSFRLVPAAITFYNKGYPFLFISGYPGIFSFLNALVNIKGHTYFPFVPKMGWWEFDIYIGLLGVAVLSYFGVYLRFSKDPSLKNFQYKALDMPFLVITLFSFSFFYKPIVKSPLPFVNAERYSSRFIIIPILFLLVISVIRFQQIFSIFNKKKPFKLLATFGILQMVFSLSRHTYIWRIVNLEKRIYGRPMDLSIQTIKLQDHLYINSVKISALTSLITICIVFVFASWAILKRLLVRQEKLKI